MQHREDKKSLIGATSANSFAQSQLPSTEELNSRCGSRQSLLDTASHRSKSNLSVAAAHQYSNAGCTSRIVPPSGADNSRTERNSTNPSPGNYIWPYTNPKRLCYILLSYEELGFWNQLHFVLDASNQYQQTLSTKGIGNNSSNSDMRKQRVAMKKDLQRKLDHWDKDTDKSR